MRSILAFTLSFALSLQAAAAGFCLSALLPSRSRTNFKEAVFKSEEGNFKYLVGKSTFTESAFEADKILPELNPENRVVLVVGSAHTFLSYRGHRIDSSGIGGIEVTTYLKKADIIKGDIAAVIYDLPPKILNDLDQTLDRFKTESFATCARATCSYLGKLLPNHPFLMRPSAVVKMLMAMKLNGSKIEFVTLNNETLKNNLEVTQSIEASHIKNLALPALGVAGLLTSIFTLTRAR